MQDIYKKLNYELKFSFTPNRKISTILLFKNRCCSQLIIENQKLYEVFAQLTLNFLSW